MSALCHCQLQFLKVQHPDPQILSHPGACRMPIPDHSSRVTQGPVRRQFLKLRKLYRYKTEIFKVFLGLYFNYISPFHFLRLKPPTIPFLLSFKFMAYFYLNCYKGFHFMESEQSSTDSIANLFLRQMPTLGASELPDAPWWQCQVPKRKNGRRVQKHVCLAARLGEGACKMLA